MKVKDRERKRKMVVILVGSKEKDELKKYIIGLFAGNIGFCSNQ